MITNIKKIGFTFPLAILIILLLFSAIPTGAQELFNAYIVNLRTYNLTVENSITNSGTVAQTGLTSANGGLRVGATGTSLSAINLYTISVVSGATSATLTNAGIAATDKVIGAIIIEDATTDVAISSVVPAAGSLVVTVTGNPGASGADIQVTLAK